MPDHVVYAGSLSKSLVPGLRLSWLVVPSALRYELVAARMVTDRFTASITQATAAEFLQRGDLDRYLRRTRRSYRQRRDALISALQRQLPGIHATGISAGLHVVVQLPDGMDAAHIAATAARHGILLTPSTTTGPTMNGPVPLPSSSATAGSRPTRSRTASAALPASSEPAGVWRPRIRTLACPLSHSRPRSAVASPSGLAVTARQADGRAGDQRGWVRIVSSWVHRTAHWSN